MSVEALCLPSTLWTPLLVITQTAIQGGQPDKEGNVTLKVLSGQLTPLTRFTFPKWENEVNVPRVRYGKSGEMKTNMFWFTSLQNLLVYLQ